VALAQGGRLLGERLLGGGEQPGAVVVPIVSALLAEAGVGLEAVGAIALSIGPGSFTGLRIGLATVLGLTFTHDVPVVPVPTLAALSLAAGEHGAASQLVPVLDARKGQVYTGLYRGGAACVLEDRVCDPAPWFAELAARPGDYVLVGSGVHVHGEVARAALGARARLLGPEVLGPRPALVAELGERLRAAGAGVGADEIRLRYLRASEAERSHAAALA
jgi:tRNA threonylcarbamoyladenosine biosynthesis protein TsaB